MWQKKNSKTQIMTRLKNSNNDKTQKFKLWQNSKNSNCDKTQKIKLWLNSETQIVTVVIVTVVTVAVVTVAVVTVPVNSFSKKKTLHLDNQWNVLVQLFAILAMF